jgi:cobalt-zinc-cadmium resistance protein CzcA
MQTQLERVLKERFPDEIEHIFARTGTAEVATDESVAWVQGLLE